MKIAIAVGCLAVALFLSSCSPRSDSGASAGQPAAPQVEDYNPLFNAKVNGRNVKLVNDAWRYQTPNYSFRVAFSGPETVSLVNEDDKAPLGFQIGVSNLGQAPIRIIWEESSFIDSEGTAQRLYVRDIVNDVLNPPSSEQRNATQKPTIIPPGANALELVSPAGYTFDVLGSRLNIGVVDAEDLAANKVVRGLYLTMAVNDKKQALNIQFTEKR